MTKKKAKIFYDGAQWHVLNILTWIMIFIVSIVIVHNYTNIGYKDLLSNQCTERINEITPQFYCTIYHASAIVWLLSILLVLLIHFLVYQTVMHIHLWQQKEYFSDKFNAFEGNMAYSGIVGLAYTAAFVLCAAAREAIYLVEKNMHEIQIFLACVFSVLIVYWAVFAILEFNVWLSKRLAKESK